MLKRRKRNYVSRTYYKIESKITRIYSYFDKMNVYYLQNELLLAKTMRFIWNVYSRISTDHSW